MSKFNSPLENFRVASPCPANWDEMYGDERKRFCGDCKLNVYNLSGMTRREAEDLITNWEGRLCVRFYRRADGSVLTQDCPIGWAAVKRRLSRAATAVFSMFAGLFTGVAGTLYLRPETPRTVMGEIPVTSPPLRTVEVLGDIAPSGQEPIMGKARVDGPEYVNGQAVVGEIPFVIEAPVVKKKNRKR